MAQDKLAKQVIKEFAEQDKENTKLVSLEKKYGQFIVCHEFGKCWLGKVADGGFILVDRAGKELKRWSAGVNCWAEACDIINKK